MKKYLLVAAAMCAGLILVADTNAQNGPAETMFRGTGKTAVVIVGTAGKITYKTAKFAAKHVVRPTAKIVLKPLATKVAPKAAKFSLKLAGKAAKQTFRTGGKLGFAYLKTKMP